MPQLSSPTHRSTARTSATPVHRLDWIRRPRTSGRSGRGGITTGIRGRAEGRRFVDQPPHVGPQRGTEVSVIEAAQASPERAGVDDPDGVGAGRRSDLHIGVDTQLVQHQRGDLDQPKLTRPSVQHTRRPTGRDGLGQVVQLRETFAGCP